MFVIAGAAVAWGATGTEVATTLGERDGTSAAGIDVGLVGAGIHADNRHSSRSADKREVVIM
jgi:hypothetical protein